MPRLCWLLSILKEKTGETPAIFYNSRQLSSFGNHYYGKADRPLVCSPLQLSSEVYTALRKNEKDNKKKSIWNEYENYQGCVKMVKKVHFKKQTGWICSYASLRLSPYPPHMNISSYTLKLNSTFMEWYLIKFFHLSLTLYLRGTAWMGYQLIAGRNHTHSHPQFVAYMRDKNICLYLCANFIEYWSET